MFTYKPFDTSAESVNGQDNNIQFAGLTGFSFTTNIAGSLHDVALDLATLDPSDGGTVTVSLYSDSGGKATAALVPIRGADRIARLFLGILKKAPTNLEVRWVRVNGQPGVIAIVDGEVIQVLTFDIVDGRIATCFVIRNPDKLARIRPTTSPPG